MTAVNKLVCRHVRTMFMFVSLLYIQQGCHAWIIQTQIKSLAKVWRFKTDLLDFQYRHKYNQTMKEKEG